jgi:hypothetical protein
MSILNQSLENIKLLSDQQLGQVLQDARSGNGQVLQALGMQSAVPLLAEKARRDNLRQAQSGQQAMQQGQQPTIADQVMGQGQAPVSGIGAHEIPGMMEEQNFAGGGIVAFAGGGQPQTPEELRQRTMMAESGGNPNAIGPETKYGRAKGDMQVLDMTNSDPGFGVVPARNDSKEERSRVGKDYLDAMVKKYNYYPYASLAYNWGPGNVDNWIKRGANPAEIPKESLAYVKQTTGTNLANMGPGAVVNLPKSAPQGIASVAPEIQNSAAPAGPDFASRVRELDPIRREREKAVKDAFDAEMGIVGEAPTPSNKEDVRRKAFEESAAVDKPLLEEMQALNEANKPSEKSARDKAFLALMTGRGRGLSGAIGDIAAAGGIGLDAYTAAQSKHEEAQRLMLKSKLELAKGNKQYADQIADAAVREDRNAASLHRQAKQLAYQNYQTGIRSVDQAMDARLAIERSIEDSRLREAGLDRRENDRARQASELASKQEFQAQTQTYRSLLGAINRVNSAIDKDFDPTVYKNNPTYQDIKIQQGSNAADAWAKEQARKEAQNRALVEAGSSPEEFAELSRLIKRQAGIAGVAPSTPAAPSPAAPAKGDYVYNPKTGKSEQIK